MRHARPAPGLSLRATAGIEKLMAMTLTTEHWSGRRGDPKTGRFPNVLLPLYEGNVHARLMVQKFGVSYRGHPGKDKVAWERIARNFRPSIL